MDGKRVNASWSWLAGRPSFPLSLDFPSTIKDCADSLKVRCFSSFENYHQAYIAWFSSTSPPFSVPTVQVAYRQLLVSYHDLMAKALETVLSCCPLNSTTSPGLGRSESSPSPQLQTAQHQAHGGYQQPRHQHVDNTIYSIQAKGIWCNSETPSCGVVTILFR